jgi:hypothetical protein
MFRMGKDLKVVLGKGKAGGSKKTGLFKKDQYFRTYHIGRT